MTQFFATDFDVGYCDDPKCQCVHFKFRIPEGHTCLATVHLDHLSKFIERIQNIGYHLATLKTMEE